MGLRVVLVEKGCLCNSLFHYPSNMTFFTTPELLEIGDIPFASPNQKPNRSEALEYYRKVAEHYQLDVRQYHHVQSVSGENGAFVIQTADRFERPRTLPVAKNYYCNRLLRFAELPEDSGRKSLERFCTTTRTRIRIPDLNVLVIGGKNSAAIAALDLWRHGSRVTLVHRGPAMHRHVKYWILPDIENRIKNGEIDAFFQSRVTSIDEDSATIVTPIEEKTISNDYVFALTGYHPDFDFLLALGIRLEGEDRLPVCNPQTLESNVEGVYLAGVIVAGKRTNEIFIENGRFHGHQIAADLKEKVGLASDELCWN